MIYNISGQEPLELRTIILDLNSTLSVSGIIVEGVKERLGLLKQAGFQVILFTGNTRGNAEELTRELGIKWKLARSGKEKRELAEQMEPENCIAIGNGLIDVELMKVVKLRIVTLQAEGIHTKTLLNSDIIVPTINDAIDLLLDTERLIATVRP